jgi:hypothetical protein
MVRVNSFNVMRPYAPENTGSRLISEVKQGTAQSVLWWGTTREYWVLHVLLFAKIIFKSWVFLFQLVCYGWESNVQVF